MSRRSSVAVIIPAFNAEATIGDCLAAICAQVRPGDEVIVFDDGATDRTHAIATAFPVKILKNDGSPKGPGHGRNAAAIVATSELLLFVDADVIIAADALDLLAAEVAKTGAVAAFGSYDDRPRSLRYTSLYANLRHHHFHQHSPRQASTFWSGIGMMQRRIFLSSGGYDAELFRHPSIEDVELGARVIAAGYQIRLVPEAQGKHCKDWSLFRVWHTDVVRRAYPWAGLIADGQTAGADLNVAARERASALFAGLILLSLAGTIAFPPAFVATLVAIFGYLFLNRVFFGFLARRMRPDGLLVAVLLHWCYHIYASATFVAVVCATRLGIRPRSHYMEDRLATR